MSYMVGQLQAAEVENAWKKVFWCQSMKTNACLYVFIKEQLENKRYDHLDNV